MGGLILGDDLVGAALRWGETGNGLALAVGGDGQLLDQGFLGFRLPVAAAVFRYKGVKPLIAHNLDRDLFIGQALPGPIDGDQIDGGLLTGISDVLLRA